MMPLLDGVQRANTLVGGASLWVMKGKTDQEYEAGGGVPEVYHRTRDGQKYIVENTGYIPVRQDGLDLLNAEGFYTKPENAGRELAITSLTASNGMPATRGIRLGNYTSIRKALRSELEAAFSGQKEWKPRSTTR